MIPLDATPLTVTLPAHIWPHLRRAAARAERYHAQRAARNGYEPPPGARHLDRDAAASLAAAQIVIADALTGVRDDLGITLEQVIIRSLIRMGWDSDAIAAFLLARANGLSAHFLEQADPHAYVAQAIARARLDVSPRA